MQASNAINAKPIEIGLRWIVEDSFLLRNSAVLSDSACSHDICDDGSCGALQSSVRQYFVVTQLEPFEHAFSLPVL